MRTAFLSALLVALISLSVDPGPASAQEGAPQPLRACDRSGSAEASLTGVVRDPKTEVPLPGARVFAWRRATSDSVVVEVGADSLGRFELCGGGAETTIGLRARVGTREGEVVEVAVPRNDRRPVRRDLAVSPGRPGEVLGRVLDASDQVPVEAATVSVPGLEVRAVTADDGRFELPPLPPGRYEVRVEHVGHGRHTDSIRVQSARTVRLRMRITRDPVRVAPLEVEVREVRSMRLEQVGFYDRKQRGHGTYITRQQIEEWNTSHLSEAFRRIQGFSPGGPPIRRSVQGNRDPRASTRSGPCRTQYFVNGEAQPLPNGIDTFLPADIAAVEVYRGAAQLPAEFNRRSASCGAVVLWLRVRPESGG